MYGLSVIASVTPSTTSKTINKIISFIFQGGADAGGWEEYFDYIFPEDEGAKPNLKLLAMAKMWKKKKEVEPEPETETSTPEKETKEESDSGKFCQISTISKKKLIPPPKLP